MAALGKRFNVSVRPTATVLLVLENLEPCLVSRRFQPQNNTTRLYPSQKDRGFTLDFGNARSAAGAN